MKFEIKNRFTGAVQFNAEINAEKETSDSVKIGLAVKCAVNSGADLSGADLRGANLRDADLGDAYLGGADLGGAKGIPPIPKIDNLDGAILAAIEAGGALEMGNWHGPDDHWCGTTHCRAGWAIHEAGQEGKALQDAFGVAAAGALIYAASYPDLPVPDFYCSNEAALKNIEARAI